VVSGTFRDVSGKSCDFSRPFTIGVKNGAATID
jgi:hypothetical protein